jgi:hypothetical protein
MIKESKNRSQKSEARISCDASRWMPISFQRGLHIMHSGFWLLASDFCISASDFLKNNLLVKARRYKLARGMREHLAGALLMSETPHDP